MESQKRISALGHYKHNHTKKLCFPPQKPGEIDFEIQYYTENEGWKNKDPGNLDEHRDQNVD